MGTKAEWRNGKLRFYGNPMFTSVATQTTNIRKTSTAVADTTTLVVSLPMYAGTLSTERNMSFHAHIGGVVATSSAWIVATLRYDTDTVLEVLSSTILAKHVTLAYGTPYSVDFHGRFVHCSTVGHISACGIATVGHTTCRTNIFGTAESTAGAHPFSTSDINMRTDSTLGLNVTLHLSSTAAAAVPGSPNRFTNTVCYIELFSG